jgi:hypothetical protein
MLTLLFSLSSALADTPDIGGDFKQFFIAGFPYDHLFMPEEPYGQGFVDGRLKLKWRVNSNISFEAHHVLTMGSARTPSQLELELSALGPTEGSASAIGVISGVGLQAPEAIDLSWGTEGDGALSVQGRTDRLNMKATFGTVDLQIGRQPVVFGNAFIFNPRDLVLPFSASVIDAEYKPGVDAMRADVYVGTSGQITAVAAYMGDWNVDQMFYAIDAKMTVASTDISGFLGEVQGDHVVGAGFSANLGPVGWTGDSTVTLSDDTDPFVRGSTGILARPGEKTTLNAELYVQTNGADSSEGYLAFAEGDPRFQRGEVWLMGRYYGAFGVTQELHPLLTGSTFVVANLADGSGMVSASLSFSASDNIQINTGAYFGAGERPQDIDLAGLMLSPTGFDVRSEFGMVPTMVYAQTLAYF